MAGDTTGTINYQQYCSFRLPCGVCTRTNSMCPLCGGVISPTWGPNIVYTGGGTSITSGDYSSGVTAAKVDWEALKANGKTNS